MEREVKSVQLDRLSVKQLRDLKARVDRLIGGRRRDARKTLMTQFKKLAAESGFPLSEVVGKRRKSPRKSDTLFVNPDNPAQTWGGRGRKPKWLNDRVKAGVSLEKMRAR
jgi:DNA-binding protein H-NS